MACASKASAEHGGVSVDVRDGREVRLYDMVDRPEIEPTKDERERERCMGLSATKSSMETVRPSPTDAGQWPNREPPMEPAREARRAARRAQAHVRAARQAVGEGGERRGADAERSRGGITSLAAAWRGLSLSSPKRLSPQRLSAPRLLRGRTGSLCFGSLIARSSKPTSSSEEGSSDHSAGLLDGPSSMLRRRFFVPAFTPAVQMYRLRASVCACPSSHSCTISRSQTESETKSNAGIVAIASFR